MLRHFFFSFLISTSLERRRHAFALQQPDPSQQNYLPIRHSPKATQTTYPPNLTFQKLEDRKMLAAVNFNSGTGALVVVGNAIADTISLTDSEDHQSFTVDINNNASLRRTFNYSDVTSVRVVAGDGDDFVYNTLLMDTEIFGQDGDDRLEGGFANDLVMGGNGVDILVGRNGDDVLNGQDGDDWLFGGPGVDALSGITGNDNLYGGVGDDTLNGHGGNDSLWGDAGDDSLFGGAGDDLLRGQDGNDTINGAGGDDWLVGGDGDDTLHGDAGSDELLGQNGNDILNGGANNDILYAGDGDDTLRGDSGSDQLYGHAGDDLLDAGSDQAADVLTGGKGLDEFVVAGSIGSGSADAVTDRAGFETYNGFSGTLTALAELDGNVLTITGMPGDDKIQIFKRDGQNYFEVKSEHQSLGIFSTAATSEIVINGGAGDDLIDNVTNSIVPMRVNGGAGEDIIYGGDGDDILNGGSDGDKIWGGNGEDTLSGDSGNDDLYGQDDNDTLIGGDGDDKLWGGLEDDKLYGEAGSDVLYGESGEDFLAGGADGAYDDVFGGGGVDEFFILEGKVDLTDASTSEQVATLQEQVVSQPTARFQEMAFQTKLLGDALSGEELDDATLEQVGNQLTDDVSQQIFNDLILYRTPQDVVVFQRVVINGQTVSRFVGNFSTDLTASQISDLINSPNFIADTVGDDALLPYLKPTTPNNAQPTNKFPTFRSGQKPSLNTIVNTYQVADDTLRVPLGPIGVVLGGTDVTDTEADMLENLLVEGGFLAVKEAMAIRDRSFVVSERNVPQSSPNPNIPNQQVGEDGHRDAFRHAYWSALLTMRFGVGWAETFTTAHEGRPNNNQLKEAMDLYNNSQGIGIAQRPEFLNANIYDPTVALALEAAINEALSNGSLVVVDSTSTALQCSNLVAVGDHGNANTGGTGALPATIPTPKTYDRPFNTVVPPAFR